MSIEYVDIVICGGDEPASRYPYICHAWSGIEKGQAVLVKTAFYGTMLSTVRAVITARIDGKEYNFIKEAYQVDGDFERIVGKMEKIEYESEEG